MTGDGTPTAGRRRGSVAGVAYRGPPRGLRRRSVARRRPTGRRRAPPRTPRQRAPRAPPTGAPCPRRPRRPQARAPSPPPAGSKPRSAAAGGGRRQAAGHRGVADEGRARSPATWAAATSSRPASGTSATCRATPPTCPAEHKGAVLGAARRRRRQRLRAALRGQPRPQAAGQPAQAAGQGRQRGLPRDRRGPRGRGHRLAPGRHPQAARPGAPDGLPRDHPARRSPAPWPTRASSTPRWSTRRRPAASSTASTATRSARCCGRRCCPSCRPAACSRSPPASSWSASGSGWRFHAADYWSLEGTFAVPRPGRRRGRGRADHASAPSWSASTTAGWPPAATSTPPPAGSPATSCTSTRPAPAVWPRGSRAARSRSAGSTRSPTAAVRTRRSPPRRCRWRPAASSAGPPRRRCGWRSGCTRTATSPTCAPTRRTCRRRRSTPPGSRPASSTATPTSRPRRAATASKAKGAQEAHEAIRPAGDSFRTPGSWPPQLARDEFRLYELVWQRTVASQMADAVGQTVSIRLAGRSATDEAVEFTASGRTITFPGFLRAYVESRDEGADAGDDDHGSDDAERRLPRLERGQQLDTRELERQGPHHQPAGPLHRAEPGRPGSRSSASAGPSTYASIMQTIQDRGYVWKKGNALVPSFIAFAVVEPARAALRPAGRLRLHRLAGGASSTRSPAAPCGRVDWLTEFYFGGEGRARRRHRGVRRAQVGHRPAARGDRRPRGQLDPAARHQPRRRAGRRPGRPLRPVPAGRRRGRRPGQHPRGPRARRADRARRSRELLDGALGRPRARHRPGVRAPRRRQGRPLRPLRHHRGPRGQQGGAADGEPVRVDVAGDGHPRRRAASCSPCRAPWAPRRTARRSRRSTAATGPTSRRAPTPARWRARRSSSRSPSTRRWRSSPSPSSGARAAAKAPLKELGPDPVTQGEVTVREGRFGPYVTDGETNASLRKGDDVETITIERAAELLADRRARRSGEEEEGRRRRRRPRRRRRRRPPPRRRRRRRPPTPVRRGADPRDRPGRARPRWQARGRVVRVGRGRLRGAAPGLPGRRGGLPARRRPGRGGCSTSGPAPACSPRSLLAAGHEVVAVDPSAEMLAQLTARLPRGRRRPSGTAEAIPLRGRRRRRRRRRAGGPLVRPRSRPRREIRRVLRPGGVVGLIWNTRDEPRAVGAPRSASLLADEARGHEADQGVVDAFAAELHGRRRDGRVGRSCSD